MERKNKKQSFSARISERTAFFLGIVILILGAAFMIFGIWRDVYKRQVIGETVLEVKNISDGGKRVKNVSFQAHSGEVLGFAGLVGAGRTETMRMIFGADKKISVSYTHLDVYKRQGVESLCQKNQDICAGNSFSTDILADMAFAKLHSCRSSSPDQIHLFHILFFHCSPESVGKRFFWHGLYLLENTKVQF